MQFKPLVSTIILTVAVIALLVYTFDIIAENYVNGLYQSCCESINGSSNVTDAGRFTCSIPITNETNCTVNTINRMESG